MDPRLIVEVIESYPVLKGLSLQPLTGTAGLSGAGLWKLSSRIETDQPLYCLRRWPASHPSLDHLGWIHRILDFAVVSGLDFIPRALPNIHQQTIVQGGGWLWEVTPWMPGMADRNAVRHPRRMTSMMTALARFHQTTARFQAELKPSANVQERWRQLQAIPRLIRELEGYEWNRPAGWPFSDRLRSALGKLCGRFLASAEELARQINRCSLPFPDSSTGLLLDPASPSSAGHWIETMYPVQPVIRDVWWDHLLFSGNELTGLIDFGAMRLDVVACDLARLLGSCLDWTAADAEFRDRALAAYQRVRPLSQGELQLIPWLDCSGVLLGSAQWLRWLLLEERLFPNWQVVTERVEHLLGRLETLLQGGFESGQMVQ